MGHPRADLSRRGRALLWADLHPIAARVITLVAGWLYLWAALGLCVEVM